MSELNTANKFENAIRVEDIGKFLSDDELKKIVGMLNSNSIDIVFHETGPKASLFEAITIFFNEPLAKAIMTGLLTSGTYDAIKFTVLSLLSKLKNISIFRSHNKKEATELNLRLKTVNTEVNLLLSNKLTHEQNLEYMDKAREIIIELWKTQIRNLKNYEMYIIKSDNDNPETIKVMTMVQYAREQQKNRKNNK
jgi:uncharacterized short protein YbdD (DUF466 family)